MFRKRKLNEEVAEFKNSFTHQLTWERVFRHIVVLEDGKHFAAVIPSDQTENKSTIQIWNIKNQECLWQIPTKWYIGAMLLLQDNELVLVDLPGTIHRIKIDINTKEFQHQPTDTFQINHPVNSMTMMQNGWLAVGSEYGIISCWDLTKKELTKIISDSEAIITSMNTLINGSVIYGDDRGWIYMASSEGQLIQRQSIGGSAITGLVVFPDNTIVCGLANGNLWNLDLSSPQFIQNHQMLEPINNLICMPNGWIACLTKKDLKFYETPWVANYIDVDLKIKQNVREHLPNDLTHIVAEYALTLFSPPRMPYDRNSILKSEEDLVPATKRASYMG